MNDTTFVDRAADLLALRLGVEPEYCSWVADRLAEANLVGPTVEPDLQLARFLVALMAAKRPADAVLAVETFDVLPLRSINYGVVAIREGSVSSELQDQIPEQMRNTTPGAETMRSIIEPCFMGALAALINLAAGRNLGRSETMPMKISLTRNLDAPCAMLGHIPAVTQQRASLIYAFSEEPIFPYAVEGLSITAEVDGSIIHELALLFGPGPESDVAVKLHAVDHQRAA
jgi:hypothetical protein